MDKSELPRIVVKEMFKKIDFKGLNYRDLDRFSSHDQRRDEMKSFYQTFDFLELIKKWPAIVGEKMCQVTSPLKIQQDSLVIVTKHSVYSQELSFLSETIKLEIFKVLPELKPIIKRLNFQTQEGFFQQKEIQAQKIAQSAPAKLHPQSPKYKLLKIEAERLFGGIEDPELRQSMVSIFMQSN